MESDKVVQGSKLRAKWSEAEEPTQGEALRLRIG